MSVILFLTALGSRPAIIFTPRLIAALEHFINRKRSSTLGPRRAIMTSEATRLAPMLPLRQLVDRYRALAGDFGTPVPLAAFNLSRAETEQLFSSYDEDYHISRFFHFDDMDGMTFTINAEPVTHVAVDAEIESIL
jgi:hypothetical protein